MPEYGMLTLGLTFTFLLIGWVSSISISKQHGWIALLAFVPVTNPIAIILLIVKKNTNTLLPVVFYGLALVVWFSGSSLSNKIEQDRLAAIKEQLTANGEPITGLAYKKLIADPDLNVWHHPFFSNYIEAAHQTIAEVSTNKIALPTRKKFKLPNRTGHVQYERPDQGKHSFANPFERLNEHALETILLSREDNPEAKNLPKTPEASAAILKSTMESMEEDLAALNEAVSRPDTIFPRAWENGQNILLPELSELKRFTQIASLHCIYHIIRGEQMTAFENTKLGFRITQITDSDILISRLVQIAQTIFALEALNAAQTYHAWTDVQWQELESILDTYDFLNLLPASIRCDRAITFDTMMPIVSKSGFEGIKAWENFLDPEQKSQQKTKWIKPIEEIFLQDFPQAFFAKHWRLCLEGYSRLINNLDQLRTRSRTNPWNQLLEEWNTDDLDLPTIGIFGRMLIPALDRTLTRAMEAQIRIHIVKTSIALERHFLKHQSYPQTLQEMKREFPQATINDPMIDEPLKYQRTNDGYEIYSVGINGKDEKGFRQLNHNRHQEVSEDDLLWIVGEKSKLLPAVTLRPKPANNNLMDTEMMKRYGLMPIESKGEVKTGNGENK